VGLAESVRGMEGSPVRHAVHWGIYSTLGVDASWPLRGEDAAWKKLISRDTKIFNPTEFDAALGRGRRGAGVFRSSGSPQASRRLLDRSNTKTKTQAYAALGDGTPTDGFDSRWNDEHSRLARRRTMFKRDIVREWPTPSDGGPGRRFTTPTWNGTSEFPLGTNGIHFKPAEKYRQGQLIRNSGAPFHTAGELSSAGRWLYPVREIPAD